MPSEKKPMFEPVKRGFLGVAYRVKSGTMKLDDVRPGIRKAIERATQDMTLDELKGYAVATPDVAPRQVGSQPHINAAKTV